MPIFLNGPVLTLIAGPNGSGKSSVVRMLQDLGYALPHYLNADDIARTLTGSVFERNVLAQKLVREGRDAALDQGRSITYETVMSHDSHVSAMCYARERRFSCG